MKNASSLNYKMQLVRQSLDLIHRNIYLEQPLCLNNKTESKAELEQEDTGLHMGNSIILLTTTQHLSKAKSSFKYQYSSGDAYISMNHGIL